MNEELSYQIAEVIKDYVYGLDELIEIDWDHVRFLMINEVDNYNNLPEGMYGDV